jgi:hypothetical protein
MNYDIGWGRSCALWNRTNEGVWYPVAYELEPWPQYLRRIAKRLLWAAFGVNR